MDRIRRPKGGLPAYEALQRKMIGRKYSGLIIKEFVTHTRVKCTCYECGKVKVYPLQGVENGTFLSCGCRAPEAREFRVRKAPAGLHYKKYTPKQLASGKERKVQVDTNTWIYTNKPVPDEQVVEQYYNKLSRIG